MGSRRWSTRLLLTDLVRGALDLVWPQACPVCERWLESGDGNTLDRGTLVPGALMHHGCFVGLPRATEAMPRPRPVTEGAPVCWLFQDGPSFFRVLHAAKYGGRPGLLEVLGSGIADLASRTDWFGNDCILVPLPDDPLRRRRRGYSVTGLLAEAVSHAHGTAVNGNLLVRRRSQSKAQASLIDPQERDANVRSLFGVGRLAEIPAHRPLVLVEDQVTTGATMREALRCLGVRGHAILGLALGGSRHAPRRIVRP